MPLSQGAGGVRRSGGGTGRGARAPRLLVPRPAGLQAAPGLRNAPRSGSRPRPRPRLEGGPAITHSVFRGFRVLFPAPF